jgi:hypothetical protein
VAGVPSGLRPVSVVNGAPAAGRRGAVLAVGVPGRVACSDRANPRRTLVRLTAAVAVFALAAGVFVLLAERRGPGRGGEE